MVFGLTIWATSKEGRLLFYLEVTKPPATVILIHSPSYRFLHLENIRIDIFSANIIYDLFKFAPLIGNYNLPSSMSKLYVNFNIKGLPPRGV